MARKIRISCAGGAYLKIPEVVENILLFCG